MTAADYARAQRVLARRDPVIATLIRRYGPCGLAASQHTDPYRALIRAIVSQQLSTKAAETISGRLEAMFGGRAPVPSELLDASDEQLRGAGLSGQKTAYLRDLSRRMLEGTLNLDALTHLPDEDVIQALVQVKGIGRWTAEMFLMFRLHRPDVLPVGDLGIVKAIQKAYRLRKAPSVTRMERLGDGWRPYRSVACWYLWASLDNKPLSD